MKPRKDNRRIRRAKHLTIGQRLEKFLREAAIAFAIKQRMLIRPVYHEEVLDLKKIEESIPPETRKDIDLYLDQHLTELGYAPPRKAIPTT